MRLAMKASLESAQMDEKEKQKQLRKAKKEAKRARKAELAAAAEAAAPAAAPGFDYAAAKAKNGRLTAAQLRSALRAAGADESGLKAVLVARLTDVMKRAATGAAPAEDDAAPAEDDAAPAEDDAAPEEEDAPAEEDAAPFDEDQETRAAKRLKVGELRAEIAALGGDEAGVKADLVARLVSLKRAAAGGAEEPRKRAKRA